MMQDDLFNYKPPAKYPNAPGWTEPTTSKAAAQAIKPHMTYQQNKIDGWLLERGSIGGTYEEIAEGCELRTQSVCGRMVELCEMGRVVKTEETRPTSSRREARIYVHKEHVPKCP